MVVAQLAQQFLPISDVCGSNPVIGIILYRPCVYCGGSTIDPNGTLTERKMTIDQKIFN